ncbi:hypothetical protein APUTEX25_001371, partial [Auxenochlorella protothecoides]
QPQLAWLPATHASLALRVLSLDAALVPRPGEAPARQSLEGYCRALRPAVVDGKQGRVVAGQPLGIGGRVRPVSFPPLPHKMLYGPRREFAFPLAQFQRDVVNNSDASIAVARPKGVGRGRGRGRGRGSALAAAEGRRPGVSRATPRIVGSSKKERRAMLTQKSELAKEFENSGSGEWGNAWAGRDSERHYGTDFDEDQEEFNAGGSAVPSAGGDLPSGAPSALPSEDEAISAPRVMQYDVHDLCPLAEPAGMQTHGIRARARPAAALTPEMEKVTGMVLDHALQWGAQMLIVWFVGLSLGYLLPRPRWLQKGLVWKELALQTTTGSWFKRVTLALHALLVVREILLRLCPPGTFQAAWRSLWPSTQVSAFAAAAAVACVDDAADAPRLALAAGSHAPPHPADAEWWITESDWQVFRDACEGEGAPGQPRWEDMCRKEFPDCIYTAQRRTLHCGRTEYRSTTVLRDAGAEAVMDFYLDDDVRAVWDPMISEHSLVESRAVAGNPGARCQVVRWLRTFPFAFISSREYVLGRRVFRDAATGALYGITRSVDHPGVRRCGRHVRMEDCHSMWRSRSVEWPGEPGRRAAETVLLHFEDLGIPEHVARFAIRHGMVGFLKRMLPEARAFLARRAEKLDVDEPDPDAYARRVAAGADGGCLLLSQAHGVASQAHPLPPRADADGAADSTEASSWSSRGSSVSMPSMRRLGH